MSTWLTVGLGNPGTRYASTRHNAGARAIERLAGQLGARLGRSRHKAMTADVRVGDHKLVIARPTTYMNESGLPVQSLLSYLSIPTERLIVVHDDIDLGEGTLRLKFGGGTGGQHGIESIVATIKDRDFYRVRVGVGRPSSPRADPGEFVLQPISKAAAGRLAAAEADAAEAVLAIVSDGLERAMNRFNSKGTGHGGRGAVPKDLPTEDG